MGSTDHATLAALVHIDMVASTEHLEREGVSASIDARRTMRSTVVSVVREHGGEVVDVRGDGMLARFESSLAATHAALVIQRRVGGAADESSPAESGSHDGLRLRIGVDAGELASVGRVLGTARSTPGTAPEPEADARTGHAGGDLRPGNGHAGGIVGEIFERVVRLEQVCLAGEVLVGENMARLLAGVSEIVTASAGIDGPDGGESLGTSGAAHRVTAGPPTDAHAPDAGSAQGVSPATPELVAVMFTRVVMRTDGDAGAVLDRADEITSAAVARHGGRVVDANGSGVVALFDSVSGSLAAGADLLRSAAGASLRSDVAVPFTFSVAIAAGDVTETADGIYGRAVVEAARVEAQCPGGDMIVTDLAVRLVADRALADLELPSSSDLGPIRLKGLSDEVGLHEFAGLDVAAPLLPLPNGLETSARFPLVGRDSALGLLRSSLDQSGGDEFVAVIVSGEEGIGKSRLVSDLACEAHADGAIVLFGSCTEDRAAPYKPLAAALDAAAVLDDDLARAASGNGGPLAPLFASAPGGSHAEPTVTDRYGFFDAVATALRRLSRIRPVVLVVDDIQWARHDTAQLLRHLIDDGADARVLVLVTYRTGHHDRDHPVHGVLDAVRRSPQGRLLELDRLAAGDVTTLLESRTGKRLREDELEFARHLRSVTGGSPLYINELLVHFVATGVLVAEPSGWVLTVATDELPLPDSIREMVARRAASLGEETLDVLTTAAVIGSTFDLEVLADVEEASIDSLLDLFEAALATRLVREGGRPGRLVFTDEIVRDALLNRLRPTRRALIHEWVGEALERVAPDDIDGLAEHWTAAVSSAAAPKAIRYVRSAAERDERVMAWESAVERYRRTLDLLDVQRSVDDALRSEVWLGLGLSMRALGDPTYRDALREAATHARAAGRADLLGRAGVAAMRPGGWYFGAGDVDAEIVAVCEDALLLLPTDDPLRARVLAALVTTLAFDSDAGRRAALLAEARDLAHESGDLRLVGTVLTAEILTTREPDAIDRRREIAGDLRRIGRATGDLEVGFVGGLFEAICAVEGGEIAAARNQLDELEQKLPFTRNFWFEFVTSSLRTSLDVMACAPTARAEVDALRDRFVDQPVDWFGNWAIHQCMFGVQTGTAPQMLIPIAEAAEQGDEDWGERWNYALAMAYVEIGRHEDAEACIEGYPHLAFDDYWMACAQTLGTLGHGLGRPDVCEWVLHHMLRFRGRLALVGRGSCISAQVSTSVGQAALGLGDFDLAEELFRESIEQAHTIGAPYFLANSRRFLATTLIERDAAHPEVPGLLHDVEQAAMEHGFGSELTAVAALRSKVTRTTSEDHAPAESR